ncbi:MAG: glycosyltransferase family 39 protein [Deltaproteobacteria bacterium]|nr:glycosyltransferase family 39 protein [Deltaproteobacteria bacterium]
MKSKRTVFICAVLFAAGFISRWSLVQKGFSSLDSVLYAIGTFDYSIQNNTPPSPGYFLYIMSGHFLNFIFHDPHKSLIFLSVFYSAGIATLLFLLGKELFSQKAGLIAALLFLTSPVFWYKGITIYGYINSSFFLLLTAYFCSRVILGKSNFIYWCALGFAIAVGVRPQDFIPLFFLVLYTFWKVSWRLRLRALFLFGFTCLLWFVPLISMSGGFKAYLSVLQYGSGYLVENSIIGGDFFSQIHNHLVRLGQYIPRSYFLGLLPLIYSLGRIFNVVSLKENKNIQFLCLLIFPQLLFNIFIQFAEIGHGLAWGLGGFLVIAESILIFSADCVLLWKKIENKFFQRINLCLVYTGCIMTVLVFILGFNVILFFHNFRLDLYNYDRVIFDDRQFNYADLKTLHQHLLKKVGYIKEHYEPKEILILSSRFYAQLYYEFPKATVVRAESIVKKGKNMLFVCRDLRCQYTASQNKISVPLGVQKLIIFDEPSLDDVNSEVEKKNIHLDEGTNLLEINVEKFREILFSHQRIELLR